MKVKAMVSFSVPNEKGNSVVSNGKVKEIFEHLVADLKPEAAYMYPLHGQRGGHFIVNMTDSSEVATIAERFWLWLGADVTITPVMGPEDLQHGLAQMTDILKKFA